MEYKHNSMRLSCKCRPAVVEFRVTTGIPELNINFGHPVFHLYILKIDLVEIKDFLIKLSIFEGVFTVFACLWNNITCSNSSILTTWVGLYSSPDASVASDK